MRRAYWRALHWAFQRRLIPLRLMYRLDSLVGEFRPYDPRTPFDELAKQHGWTVFRTQAPEGWGNRRPDGPTISSR